MVEASTKVTVDSQFDFAGVAYVSVYRRKRQLAVHIDYGRVRVHRPDADDMERIAEWLTQDRIYLPLGFPRPPFAGYVRRSALPDGTGALEAVEFLVLKDALSHAPLGFYLCYEARRTRWQEVDFAFRKVNSNPTVSLLRAGRIATLTYLFAVCGADRVSWIRRKRDAKSGRYRKQGKAQVMTVERFIATLRRLEEYIPAHLMPVIEATT